MDFPEKLFVARSYINHNQVNGYIIDATKSHTKAFETKKERAEYWANKNKLPSLYIDNVPTTGFCVVDKLTIHARETYFTIRHPEGFEFMISSKNMNDLIINNDIIKGVFVDPMFFNNNLELINGKTKAFAKLVDKENKKEKQKEIVAGLKVGDGFTYNKEDYYYCGKVHAICIKKTKEFAYPDKSSVYHLVFNSSRGTYALNQRLDNYKLEPRALLNKKTTTDEEIKLANEFWQSYRTNRHNPLGESNIPVLVHNKSFKAKDLKMKYEEINVDDLMNNGRFNENVPFMTKDNEQTYRVFFGVSNNTTRSYYGRSGDYTIHYNDKFERFSAYPVQIDDNGIMVMDVDINTHSSFSTWNGYRSPFFPPNERKTSSTRYYQDKPCHVQLAISNPLYIGKYYL